MLLAYNLDGGYLLVLTAALMLLWCVDVAVRDNMSDVNELFELLKEVLKIDALPEDIKSNLRGLRSCMLLCSNLL